MTFGYQPAKSFFHMPLSWGKPWALALAAALVLLVLLTRTGTALAAPAFPGEVPLTQPDGSTFNAVGWGDETSHGFETVDGYTILLDESSGFWVYAVEQNGLLVPARTEGGSLLVAGRDRPDGLPQHARPQPPAGGPGFMPLEAGALEENFQGGPRLTPNTGTHRLLMIMVNFSNISTIYTPAQFNSKAFGAANSIADYYAKASYGQLTILPAAETCGTAGDGVVEVMLDFDHPSDTNYSQIIAAAALRDAETQGCVHSAQYDTDGDGYVTTKELHIIFIIAGYEESYSCDPNCTPNIWGHRWGLDSGETLDGKIVGVDSIDGDPGGYAMFGERHGYTWDHHIAQIGIMVHELGHDLSWPDLYDTDGTSAGIGRWSVMASGSWNPPSSSGLPGSSPAMPDAFLKWYQGWITPTSVTPGHTYNLRSAVNYPDVLIIGTNPNGVDWNMYTAIGTGEYWLVENRYLTGYDAGLPACGILIWHIDETRRLDNDANTNENRRLVDLEQADGFRSLNISTARGDAGDPYPGSSNNTVFGPSSNPSSEYYDGSTNFGTLTINTGCSATMQVSFIVPVQDQFQYLPMLLQTSQAVGNVTDEGSPAVGVEINLYRSSDGGSSFFPYAQTNTDSTGHYAFDAPAAGGSVQYIVAYENSEDYDTRLAYFECNPVTSLVPESICDINVRDVGLVSPSHGASITFPATFRWDRRITTTDQYSIEFYEYYSYAWHLQVLSWPPYGFIDHAVITNAYWAYTGTWYYWSMRVFTPHGWGTAYWARSIWFNNLGSPAMQSPGWSQEIPAAPTGKHKHPAAPNPGGDTSR